MDSMLQSFLRAGMLNIGSDDSKFDALKKAADEVSKGLDKDHAQIVPCVLVSLDPNFEPSDPVMSRVENAIEKHWKTYRNAFSDEPRQVVRAVLFDALRSVSKDVHLAAAIRLTADSYLSYADLGNERVMVEEFLLELRDKAEEQAIEEWGSPAVTKAPAKLKPNLDVPELKYFQPDEKTLTAHLAAASGPDDAQGTSLTDANTDWPNSGQTWSHVFAPRAAKGIVEVVGKAQGKSTELVTEALTELVKQLNEQLVQIAETTQGSAQERANTFISQQLRTALLWWREAGYSPSLRRGYRELLDTEGPIVAAAAMAFDLSQQLPALCPLSVEYFLREAVRDVTKGTPGEPLALNASLQALLESAFWPKLKALTGLKSAATNGRTSLLRFSQEPESQQQLDGTLSQRLGVSPEVPITPEDFAVWLWRDLLAERLLTNRLAPPRFGA